MIDSGKVNKMVFGGDYNPEQWDQETRQEDMRLLKLANVDILTLNVFSWAALQKDDDVYDFSDLDSIMEMVRANGFKVCLATSTGAHPAWMAKKYPEILRTEFSGTRRKFGGRHNSCPNSEVFKKFSTKLASKLAERYKDYDNIVAWHISNEYGGACYCENCEKVFRIWLRNKYKTIENLNKAWNTSFWGHTFYAWDEIVVPNIQSEHFGEDRTMFQGISLDYARFNSDSMLENYKAEYEAVKAFTPDIPVTTNLMGFYKLLDYQKWAKYMDFISWDSYPSVSESIEDTAIKHDLMRSLKSGLPFILMEQTPSVTNWQSYNSLKRPGVMRLLSYQAVAHGSDAVMFFQMRRSIGACEKFHGAVIDHAGHENTRVFRECQALGEELKQLGSLTLGARTEAKVAILFDWDNWWAIEYSAGPSVDLKYYDEIMNYYRAFHRRNISVDIISVEVDLSKYRLVIAPLMYMVKGDYDEKLKAYVKNGGTFVTSFFSGIVEEHDLVTVGGYPGKLRELLGIWVEEIDGLPNGKENQFEYQGNTYPARLLCDIMHPEGAEVLGTYQTDFYRNTPVLTKNCYGSGEAYYVGTRSDELFYETFFDQLCNRLNIKPVLNTPKGVEATVRKNENGEFTFVLNHQENEEQVTLNADYTDMITGRKYQKGCILKLEPKAVLILEADNV
ncbi:MAG TPA: beta-galactosidase [Lachnospiraceae bacterium]|nr:beta-galactosidase [Lachnospiraceae bacterium]HCA70026.1 beta-galactosidase [Lachnospiraceae bacterium]HCM14015.1 beta-galactosidase [Lachnospiraceae bacterium]HCR39736.1 beta-galactosidase [Lachnospiraceae bacterium]